MDVSSPDLNDIGVAEAGECAEAEEVAGDGHAFVLDDFLLVLLAVHIVEFELGAGLGNLEIEDFVQFVLREEDDGLFDGLEDGLVGLYIAHLRVFLTYGPAEEPGEVLVDFFG